ncbi:hypothetical protein AAHA92_15411 [Salvia divinorum]|uniref:Uncharacterized protein n=1 Tax=Salvia divinorum TaxID=28513 RepID=A0ABD1HF72_SALDI
MAISVADVPTAYRVLDIVECKSFKCDVLEISSSRLFSITKQCTDAVGYSDVLYLYEVSTSSQTPNAVQLLRINQ